MPRDDWGFWSTKFLKNQAGSVIWYSAIACAFLMGGTSVLYGIATQNFVGAVNGLIAGTIAGAAAGAVVGFLASAVIGGATANGPLGIGCAILVLLLLLSLFSSLASAATPGEAPANDQSTATQRLPTKSASSPSGSGL